REQILAVHIKKVPVAPDVNVRTIARGTPGFSGADLANLVNEAALLAARRGKKVVTMRELENAKDKVMMGAERKSMVISESEKKMTAYHEAGHALVSINQPASDPIHKATIIPRGRALGMVMRLPEADKISYLREKMYADLAIAMGGRAAEEIIFGHEKVSSGASSDIKYVTSLARAMVTEWGMSDKLGPLFYGGETQDSYTGASSGAKISGKTADVIDEEIRGLVEEAHKKATDILNEKIDHLHLIAKNLIEHETLSGDDIKALIAGENIDRSGNDSGAKITTQSSVPSSRKKTNPGSEGDPVIV
ncbi:MAG: cell division protein FtsH, partial [Pseudomonadota bacterium]